MTRDEARERMTDALDGMLGPDEQAAFDAVLGADPEFRKEFEEFTALIRATARVAASPSPQAGAGPGTPAAGESDAGPSPDLLSGVQRKLHKRSGGRYYRDRFAQQAGSGLALPVLLAGVTLLLLLVLYAATQWATVIVP
jgi:anti-sigma factor RsiW